MSSRRHIVFVNEFYHPDICASAIVAADHLPRIARLLGDCQITVIAGNRAWDNPEVVYPEREQHEGIDIVRVPRPVLRKRNIFTRAMGFASFGRNAVKAGRRLDHVDLVIGTTAPPQGGGIAQKIAVKHRCPFIYTVLDLYPDLTATLGMLSPQSFAYRWWLKRDTHVMREAAAVVTISENITDRIAETREIDRGKLFTIHDGFDALKLEFSGENSFQTNTNPQRRFVVQYAGNMGLSHPFETIMGAVERFANDSGILFQFVGDGPQRKYIASRSSPNVQLLDYQPAERLGPMLATADVCLVSQHQEMFDKALPHKIYGILAAGRPVIFVGNEKSEIAVWLRSGAVGIHVNQGDIDGLTKAIRRLKGDQAELTQMGQAAKKLFDDSFHTEQAAEKWAALIERLV